MSLPSNDANGPQPTSEPKVAAEGGEGSQTPAKPAEHRLVTSGLFRFSVTQFLAALILWLITVPFLTYFENGEVILSASMTLLLISAVLAVGGRSQSLLWAIVLVLPALAADWMDHYKPDLVPHWISMCAGLVFVGFVIAQFLRFILRARLVNSEVLCAGIAAYLMLGLLWAVAYLLAARLTPGSYALLHGAGQAGLLQRFDALYFSFVTLTCLGCNDIVPLTRGTRMLMMLEGTTGVLYLAVMIARLVALYSRTNTSQSIPGADLHLPN